MSERLAQVIPMFMIISIRRAMLWLSLLSALVFMMLCGLGCNEPALIGEDILQEEQIPIDTALFDIQLTQVEGNAFRTYRGDVNAATAFTVQVGWMEDMYFGKSTAAFSMQLVPPNGVLDDETIYEIDSVVLVLYLDTLGNYGLVDEIALNIDRLGATLDGTIDYGSDFSPALGERVVSNFVVRPSYGLDTAGEDILPRIHIPLDNALGQEILAMDSVTRRTDSLFVEAFRGLHITAAAICDGFLGVRPYRDVVSQGDLGSGLRVYMHEVSNDTSNFAYIMTSIPGNDYAPLIPQYHYDYSGSKAEEALVGTLDDSLFFVQGQGGLSVRLDFIGLEEQLEEALISKAEFTLPILDDAAFFNAYPSIRTMHPLVEDLSGIRRFAPEFSINVLGVSPQGRIDSFGIDDAIGYTFNLPASVQQIIDGRLFTTDIRMSLVPLPEIDDQINSVVGPANRGRATARSIIDASGRQLRIRTSFSSGR